MSTDADSLLTGRPGLDRLIAEAHEKDVRAARERLCVFTRTSPGVGETYGVRATSRSEGRFRGRNET